MAREQDEVAGLVMESQPALRAVTAKVQIPNARKKATNHQTGGRLGALRTADQTLQTSEQRQAGGN